MAIDVSVPSPGLLGALMVGHFLGNFVFQTGWMAGRKERLRVVAAHAGIVAVVSWALTGYFGSWALLLILWVVHFVVALARDAGASVAEDSPNKTAVLFVSEQIVRLSILIFLVWAVSSDVVNLQGVSGEGAWARVFGDLYLRLLVVVGGWVVAAPVVGFFLGILLSRFERELTQAQKEGLSRGGYWIGLSERSLIYLFILVGEPSGIGFLAAAKSVFRIGELRDEKDRKLAEYILIGTLMSFTLAMIVGLLTEGIPTALGFE